MLKKISDQAQSHEAIEIQSQESAGNETISVSKPYRYLFASILLFSVWAYFSFQSGGLFINELIICALIVNALLFFWAKDQV